MYRNKLSLWCNLLTFRVDALFMLFSVICRPFNQSIQSKCRQVTLNFVLIQILQLRVISLHVSKNWTTNLASMHHTLVIINKPGVHRCSLPVSVNDSHNPQEKLCINGLHNYMHAAIALWDAKVVVCVKLCCKWLIFDFPYSYNKYSVITLCCLFLI